jgi:hypothetical protein
MAGRELDQFLLQLGNSSGELLLIDLFILRELVNDEADLGCEDGVCIAGNCCE